MANVMQRLTVNLELFTGDKATCTINDNTLTVAFLSTKLTQIFAGETTGVKVTLGLKDAE